MLLVIEMVGRPLQGFEKLICDLAVVADKNAEYLGNLIRLDELCENGTIKEKREIVGSIFPENLTFNGDYYRTTKINEAARQIYLIENELEQNKNGTSKVNFDLCRKAEREGLASPIPWGRDWLRRSPGGGIGFADPLGEGVK
jgi:hypothetical protein